MMTKKLFPGFLAVALLLPVFSLAEDTSEQDTYDQDEMYKEASGFFGKGAEGLADVLNKVFSEKGRPNGYIKGEEASGAIVVGVRYGRGTLVMKNGDRRKVFWQGPSIGFDVGANASKAFVLIYDLKKTDDIFQRFPGIEGTLYFVAGVGVNYVATEDISLAPIRFGLGWRQGANLGYMHITRESSWIPF